MQRFFRFCKHIIEAFIVYTLYGFFAILPFSFASAIGGVIGRFVGPLLSVHKVAYRNLSKALPELDEAKKQQVLHRMWDNLGRTVAEFPHMRKDKPFRRHVTFNGEAYIESAKDKGVASIFFGGHFGNWELLPRSAALVGLPLMLVYRHANNPYVDALIQWTRKNYQAGSIPKGSQGGRALLKAIKNNQSIGMLVDQKMNNGIPVPFFGRDAMTAPSIAQMALRFGCPLLPAATRRIKGCKFEVTIFPPMDIVPTGDQEKDTYMIMTQINHFFETQIRQHPEQWFWVHNRWPKE